MRTNAFCLSTVCVVSSSAGAGMMDFGEEVDEEN